MAKATDVRPKITLACTECKERNYITKKNRRNDPDRIELKKCASSLSYLRQWPVHEVKIDDSFVQGMATDSGDLAIVRAVISLSREFGLTVVAEGVVSELTLELLEEMGCEIGQGYLFSRPLPYDRLEAWFSAQTEPESTPTGEVRRLRAVI